MRCPSPSSGANQDSFTGLAWFEPLYDAPKELADVARPEGHPIGVAVKMERAKTVFRVAGTILVALGLLSLPHGPIDNPKRHMNAFAVLADLGAFTQAAWILIAVGAVALILSFFMTDRES